MNRRGFLKRIGAAVAVAPLVASAPLSTVAPTTDLSGATNMTAPRLKMADTVNSRTIIGSSNVTMGNLRTDALTVTSGGITLTGNTVFSGADILHIRGTSTFDAAAAFNSTGVDSYVIGAYQTVEP